MVFEHPRTIANKGLAETERFELSVPSYQYDGLANRWFQPLTHVSGPQQRGRAIARVAGCGKGRVAEMFGRLPDSLGRKSESAHRRFIAAGPAMDSEGSGRVSARGPVGLARHNSGWTGS